MRIMLFSSDVISLVHRERVRRISADTRWQATSTHFPDTERNDLRYSDRRQAGFLRHRIIRNVQ
jgi:hypothetical protein